MGVGVWVKSWGSCCSPERKSGQKSKYTQDQMSTLSVYMRAHTHTHTMKLA